MAFDPEEAQKYLDGVEYPVSKETLLTAVEKNGAPEEIVELVAGLPLGHFSEHEEFMNHVRAIPNTDT